MDSEPARSSRSAGGTLLILLLPFLYMLSSGPAMFVLVKWHPGPAYNKVATSFYAPLGWLHDHTPLRKPLAFYVDWWVALGSVHKP